MLRPGAVLGIIGLLAGTGCKDLRLPAPPAQSAGSVGTGATATAAPATPAAGAAKRPVSVDPALDAGRFGQIRRGLRRLVASEETYYAENGIYTDDLSRIGYRPEGDAQVRFLWVTRDGWAASGTHPGMPGRDCVIYVGRSHGTPTTMRDVRRGAEGVPVCDGAAAVRRDTGAVAAAQPARPSPSSAGSGEGSTDTANALEAVGPSVQMRVDLRNLVKSQDSYYGTQGQYSRRTDPFALQYLWHRGVTITILTATDASWSAKATSAERPGRSCVIYVGPVLEKPATDVQRRVPQQAGTPVCDDIS